MPQQLDISIITTRNIVNSTVLNGEGNKIGREDTEM